MSGRAVVLAVVATVLWGGWALLADAAADDLSPVFMLAFCGACPTVALVVVAGMHGLPAGKVEVGAGLLTAIVMAVIGLTVALSIPTTDAATTGRV